MIADADRPHVGRARSASMLRLAMPIALAGLGGLYAERSGTVNIGLEGMMIMGTIFAGWWGWHCGPWMALVGGVIGGMLGGLLHAARHGHVRRQPHRRPASRSTSSRPASPASWPTSGSTTAGTVADGGSISNSPPIDGAHAAAAVGAGAVDRRPDPLGGSRTRSGSSSPTSPACSAA